MKLVAARETSHPLYCLVLPALSSLHCWTVVDRSDCVELLEEGQVVGVAVGGAEEALFDWDYSPDWRKRNGFAQLALLTGW